LARLISEMFPFAGSAERLVGVTGGASAGGLACASWTGAATSVGLTMGFFVGAPVAWEAFLTTFLVGVGLRLEALSVGFAPS
jgi:hypothetical protein